MIFCLLNYHFRSWRKIKKDYLHHFARPRVDMLVWILLDKLLPQFSHRIGRLFLGYGRARDPASWRTQFQHDWKALETRTASEHDSFRYEKYNPKPLLWVCSCPAFSQSRFLICKHLVQLHHPVPPRFFKEVSRNRSTPFWKHAGLQTLDQAAPDVRLDFTHPRIPPPEFENRPDSSLDDTSGPNKAVISSNDEGDDAVSAVGTVDSDSLRLDMRGHKAFDFRPPKKRVWLRDFQNAS